MSIITSELVSLDQIRATTPREVIQALAEHIATTDRADDPQALFTDAWNREQESATGMPGGFAIPHCRTSAVNAPTLAFARLAAPVDFGSSDGPADLVFFIAAPAGANQDHLKILSALATYLMREEFVQSLREAASAQQVVSLIQEAVAPDEQAVADAPVSASAEPAPRESTETVSLVAVTSCPTGIAHKIGRAHV